MYDTCSMLTRENPSLRILLVLYGKGYGFVYDCVFWIDWIFKTKVFFKPNLLRIP